MTTVGHGRSNSFLLLFVCWMKAFKSMTAIWSFVVWLNVLSEDIKKQLHVNDALAKQYTTHLSQFEASRSHQFAGLDPILFLRVLALMWGVTSMASTASRLAPPLKSHKRFTPRRGEEEHCARSMVNGTRLQAHEAILSNSAK